MVAKNHKKIQSFFKYLIIFIIIFGLLLTFSNYRNLKTRLLAINPKDLISPVASSLSVYIIEGLFLLTALRLFNERLSFPLAVKDSLVINSLGYFVSLGGITPFATQIHVLDYHNISARKATLTRILQVIFFGIFFDLLLIAAFVVILSNKRMDRINLVPVSIFTCFFLFLISAFYLAIFWSKFRILVASAFVYVINMAIGFVAKRRRIQLSSVTGFLDDFRTGFATIMKHPLSLLQFVGITVIDYVALLAVWYYSFHALHYEMNLWYMVLGVTIGHIVGILSMVPGGIGTMEGSLALVYTAFGVPVEITLGAALIYRVSFNIIPFFMSIPIFLSLKRRESVS
jgi:uncharacterized protein (TIRG00374 family)